eukprot:12685300-Alexandrium_andersonii.AAC.1
MPAGACKEWQLQSDGRKCGRLLDANLEHPRLCQLGAAKSRIHSAVSKVATQILKQADYGVRFEQAIPSLGRW